LTFSLTLIFLKLRIITCHFIRKKFIGLNHAHSINSIDRFTFILSISLLT